MFQFGECRPVDMDEPQIVEGPVIERIKREAQSATLNRPPIGIAEQPSIQRSKRAAQFVNVQRQPTNGIAAPPGDGYIHRSKRAAQHIGEIPPLGLAERQVIQRA